MARVTLEIHEGVLDAIKKLKTSHEENVTVVIPEGSVLFENSLNLKLLKKEAEVLKKEISFTTTDVDGQAIIDLIEGGGEGMGGDFVSREVSLDETVRGGLGQVGSKRKFGAAVGTAGIFATLAGVTGSIKSKLGNLLGGVKMPQGSFKSKLPVILGVVGGLLLLGIGGYQLLWRVPKAEVRVVVNSQPLIKSVEIQAKANVQNNVSGKVLAGKIVETVVADSKTAATTGTKLVGKKAEGKVEVYNNDTSSDVHFDKGEKLHSESNKNLHYSLDDGVTVSAAQQPGGPGTDITPGKKEVDVTATEIGKDYNLDENKKLVFDDDDIDPTDYSAKVSDKLEGGSSETVAVVAQKDMDDLSKALFDQIGTKGEEALKTVVVGDQIFIKGSAVGALVKNEFGNKLDEETKELKLTQTVSFQGLAYNTADLNAILDDLLKSFVPQGFELSQEARETNVEILGNTDANVLSLSQADLQVTIKAYVVPEVNEEELKKSLAGKSFNEAQKILGGVRNVKTYEVKMHPNIPFLGRMPKNISNISLTVERE